MGDIYIWACVQADVANKVIYIWDMPLFISGKGGQVMPRSHTTVQKSGFGIITGLFVVDRSQRIYGSITTDVVGW